MGSADLQAGSRSSGDLTYAELATAKVSALALEGLDFLFDSFPNATDCRSILTGQTSAEVLRISATARMAHIAKCSGYSQVHQCYFINGYSA